MKEYSDDLIEEIKENIDIVDFIGEYVDLTRIFWEMPITR